MYITVLSCNVLQCQAGPGLWNKRPLQSLVDRWYYHTLQCIYIFTYQYQYQYIYIYVHIDTQGNISSHVCTFTHTYIYTYAYRHIHTYYIHGHGTEDINVIHDDWLRQRNEAFRGHDCRGPASGRLGEWVILSLPNWGMQLLISKDETFLSTPRCRKQHGSPCELWQTS